MKSTLKLALPVVLIFGVVGLLLSLYLPPANQSGQPTFEQRGGRPHVTKVPQVGYLFGFDVKGSKVEGYIDFDKEGDQHHRLLFLDGKLQLQWVTPDNEWPIAEATLPDLKEGATLRIKRRNGRIVVLQENHVMMAADGLGLGNDAAPVAAFNEQTTELSAPIHRRMSNIYFSDDFMRERVSGVWNVESGAWEISSTSFADNGANPFSLYSRGADSPRFDDVHQGRAGEEFVGVGIQINPALPERRRGPVGPYVRIVRVTGNSPAAEAGIKVNALIVSVNGVSARRGDDEHPGIHFQRTRQMLLGPAGEEVVLELLSGGNMQTFKLVRRNLKWGQIDKRIKIEPYEIAETSLISTGPAIWDQYHFECSIKARLQGAAGIAFHIRDDSNYRLLRWWGDNLRSGPRHQLEIVKIVDGNETVLATAPGGPMPLQYYKLGLEVGPDYIIGKIDRKEVVRVSADDLSFGAVGLYTKSTDGVFFDDIVVSSNYNDIVSRSRPELPRGMVEDGVMSEWVELDNLWVPQLTTGVRWHDFEFKGDVQIKLDQIPDRPTRLIIAGDGTLLSRGYVLFIEPVKKQMTLFRDVLKKATAVLPEGQVLPIVFRREGNRLIATANDKKLIDWEDGNPLKKTRLGVQMRDLSAVEVSPVSYWDYTFTDAPADWEIAGGRWGMMNRWVCDPRWSWFGGQSRGVCALWHKNKFEGEMIFDAYVGLMMVRREGVLERPADIGMTIMGDGKNMYSGYTFHLAGDHNSWTRLYRNGQKVASTTEKNLLLPADYRNNRTLDAIHRHWIHVQMVKRGNVIECFFQDRLALRFEDDDPIDSGRIALWSVNNGFVVSRARIFDATSPDSHIPLRDYGKYSDTHLTNWVEEELSARVDRTEDGEYKVTNLLSGGTFALGLNSETLPRNKQVTLKFKCRIEPGAHVDVYFEKTPLNAPANQRELLKRTCKFGLTGPASPWAILKTGYDPTPIEVIGHGPDSLFEGGWHEVSIDLTPHLQNWDLSNFVIANYSNDDYLLAGFSGNKPGATYHLKDIEWDLGAL